MAATLAPESRSGWLDGLLQRHGVALVSLLVALLGLGYNTWRNETSELQRNQREAGFRLLQTVAEFQELVDRRFFSGDRSDANRVAVWGRASVIRDLAPLVSAEVEADGRRVFELWSTSIAALDADDPASERALAMAVKDLRQQLLAELRRLH